MIYLGTGPYICRSCRCDIQRFSTRLQAARPKAGLPRQLSTTARRKPILPDYPARTRFAPSPTGKLHLGSVRTALFNYLLAKRTRGQFLLRIEDTDQKRTIPGAEEQLYEDLRWAGLQWDEGPSLGGPHGPYRQSERTAIYQKHVDKLVESKHAYRCFCSPSRLDSLNRSRHERGLPLGYDRACTSVSPEESEDRAKRGDNFVIRLRAPEQAPPWQDLVYGTTGKTRVPSRKTLTEDPVFDDPIIIKSDGHPTYHLANVVDDHLMQITHVIRGSEWMSSTPIHLHLYHAFGWEPPIFGHVPLLVDENNQKLSKRNLDTDISGFRHGEAIYPDVLTNFAVLLGWSHQQPTDVLPLRRLEEIFDLKFTKGNTIVSLAKLHYLQHLYARQYIAQGGEEFQKIVDQVCIDVKDICDQSVLSALLEGRSLQSVVAVLLRADAKGFTDTATFARRLADLFNPVSKTASYDIASSAIPLSALRAIGTSFEFVPKGLWTADTHRQNIKDMMPPESQDTVAEAEWSKYQKAWKREIHHFLRWSLTRAASGPPLVDLMEALGRAVCLRRIKAGIKQLIEQENEVVSAPRTNVILRAAEA